MTFLRLLLTALWVALSYCSCTGQNIPVTIKALFPYEQEVVSDDLLDSTNSMNFKNKFYYVENYSGYHNDSLAFDKFVFKNIDIGYQKYRYYNMIFYLKSKILNKDTKEKIQNIE